MTCEISGEQTSFPNEEIASKFEDTKAITSIVIKFNDKYEGKLLGMLEDGTRARVNIPFLSEDEGDFEEAEKYLKDPDNYEEPESPEGN